FGDWNSNKKLTLPASLTINKNPNPPTLVSIAPKSATQFETVIINFTTKNTHLLNISSEKLGIYLKPVNKGGNYISPVYKSITIINDTLLQATFTLSENYYPSTVYDVILFGTPLFGKLELINSFTLNRV